MLLVINLWSRSRNGAGNLGDDGEELGEGDVGYGSFVRKTFVNDDGRNFQNTFNSHILYFWNLVDLLDVLQDTLTVLNQDLSVSSESIPTASARGVTTDKKRKQEEEGRAAEKKFKDDLSSSLSDLGYAALLEQANQAEDFGLQYLEYSIKFASDPTNGPTFKRKSEESYVRARRSGQLPTRSSLQV
jgi:hypothetical protein